MGDTEGRLSAAEFHSAEGVEDWRVTCDGPAAVFTAMSLEHAASLIAPVVAAAARHGVKPDIDVRPESVVVRVPYQDWDGMPAGVAGFAADVSAVAASAGLTADPSLVRAVSIYVAQHSEADVRPFFMAAFGYGEFGDTDAVDPLRAMPRMAFNPLNVDTAGRGRTHFDLYVPADQTQARVDAAIAAGGRLVDDSQAPMWWTVASPDNHGIDIVGYADGARP